MLTCVRSRVDAHLCAHFFVRQFVPLYFEVVEGQMGRNVMLKHEAAKGDTIFARDSKGLLRRAIVVSTTMQHLEKDRGTNRDAETRSRPVKLYVVEFSGGECATLTRRNIYTKEEINPPQSAVSIEDILPPTREVRPPTFNELQAKGVPPAEMIRHVHFAYRRAYGIEQIVPLLKTSCFATCSLELSEADVRALVSEDWGYMNSELSARLAEIIKVRFWCLLAELRRVYFVTSF